MRTSGQGLGPGFTIVATRRSVIFSLDGRELVLTPIGYASIAFAPKSVPKAAADVFKTSRRCMSSCPFPQRCNSRYTSKALENKDSLLDRFPEASLLRGYGVGAFPDEGDGIVALLVCSCRISIVGPHVDCSNFGSHYRSVRVRHCANQRRVVGDLRAGRNCSQKAKAQHSHPESKGHSLTHGCPFLQIFNFPRMFAPWP